MNYNVSQRDRDHTMLMNFHHKRWLSPDSVEAIIHKRVNDTRPDEDPVTQARNNLEWVRNLDRIISEETQHWAEARVNNLPVSEQGKLRILDETGWIYRGNLYMSKNASAYPELAFTVMTKHYAGAVWYAVSYGVVRDYKSVRHGRFSMFLTMDEVKDFIREQVHHTGRLEHYRNHANRLVKRVEHTRGEALTKEESDRLVKENKKSISEATNKFTSDSNIDYVLYKMETCSDVMAVPDLINRSIIPLAEKKLSEARDHANTLRMATELEDADTSQIERPFMNADGEIRTRSGDRIEPLPEPSERVRQDSMVDDLLSENNQYEDRPRGNAVSAASAAVAGVGIVGGISAAQGIHDDLEETNLDEQTEEAHSNADDIIDNPEKSVADEISDDRSDHDTQDVDAEAVAVDQAVGYPNENDTDQVAHEVSEDVAENDTDEVSEDVAENDTDEVAEEDPSEVTADETDHKNDTRHVAEDDSETINTDADDQTDSDDADNDETYQVIANEHDDHISGNDVMDDDGAPEVFDNTENDADKFADSDQGTEENYESDQDEDTEDSVIADEHADHISGNDVMDDDGAPEVSEQDEDDSSDTLSEVDENSNNGENDNVHSENTESGDDQDQEESDGEDSDEEIENPEESEDEDVEQSVADDDDRVEESDPVHDEVASDVESEDDSSRDFEEDLNENLDEEEDDDEGEIDILDFVINGDDDL